MKCRKGCGACCIAPSISQPYYQMPKGKQAGERCIHLDENNACLLFGSENRPDFCDGFQAEETVCGNSFNEALIAISILEFKTKME